MMRNPRSMRSPDAERLMDIAFEFQSLLMEGKVKMAKAQREKLADEIQRLSHRLGFQFPSAAPFLEVELSLYEAEAMLEAGKSPPKEMDWPLRDALKKIRRHLPRHAIEKELRTQRSAYEAWKTKILAEGREAGAVEA